VIWQGRALSALGKVNYCWYYHLVQVVSRRGASATLTSSTRTYQREHDGEPGAPLGFMMHVCRWRSEPTPEVMTSNGVSRARSTRSRLADEYPGFVATGFRYETVATDSRKKSTESPFSALSNSGNRVYTISANRCLYLISALVPNLRVRNKIPSEERVPNERNRRNKVRNYLGDSDLQRHVFFALISRQALQLRRPLGLQLDLILHHLRAAF